MSIEVLGEKFKCDSCGKEQVITIQGNKPKYWTTGYLSVVSGWSGPILHFCPDCWGRSISSREEKRPLLVKLFRRFGYLKYKPPTMGTEEEGK